jgi:hypothetical protein
MVCRKLDYILLPNIATPQIDATASLDFTERGIMSFSVNGF